LTASLIVAVMLTPATGSLAVLNKAAQFPAGAVG
jgi:hypothetical protein